MQQSYQFLLTLEFNHNYFHDGRFKSLQVSFDDETIQLFSNLGIMSKPFPGGMHFLTLDPELLREADEDTAIRLYLECKDPYYINYSELENYSPSDLLYIDNLRLIENEDDTVVSLHKGDFVGKNEVCKLSSGKFILKKPDSNNAYHFEDVFGNNISDSIRFLQTLEDGSEEYLISNLPNGAVKVLQAGTEVQRLYYSSKSVWKKPLGIVELFIRQLSDQYIQKGKQIYALNFNSNNTIWKYFLMDPVYRKFEKLHIVNSTNEHLFDTVQEPLQEEDGHWIFQSQSPIPLVEHSDEIYMLVNDGELPPVIKALPRASPEQLFYDDDTNTESKYSHIYI